MGLSHDVHENKAVIGLRWLALASECSREAAALGWRGLAPAQPRTPPGGAAPATRCRASELARQLRGRTPKVARRSIPERILSAWTVGAEGEKELKSEDNSHDVVENTCRKNVVLGVSHDVDENKSTYWDEATMLLKTKVVTDYRWVRREPSPQFLFFSDMFGLPLAATTALEWPRHAHRTPSILTKVDSNLRRLWRITQASANPGRAQGVKLIKKFQIDPGMLLKTKGRAT